MDYTAVRGRDGDMDRIEFAGIDFSNRKPLRVINLEFGRDDVLVVKHSGGTCWSGVGQPHEYVSAKFLVFKILKSKVISESGRDGVVTKRMTEYKLEMLADIPVSAGRKKDA